MIATGLTDWAVGD
jgi:hypothetical protein